jgi:peptidyl-tRNA hydrolase
MNPQINDSVVLVFAFGKSVRGIVEETYFAGAKVRLIEDLDYYNKSGASLIVSYDNIKISPLK